MCNNTRKNSKLNSINNSFSTISYDNKKINLNFSYYEHGKYGQSFQEWENEAYLADLCDKLHEYTKKGRVELITDGTLVEYKEFPPNSKFKVPSTIDAKLVTWARFRLTGSRRLAGFFYKTDTERKTFYVVFLDKNHEFYPSKKKHT